MKDALADGGVARKLLGDSHRVAENKQTNKQTTNKRTNERNRVRVARRDEHGTQIAVAFHGGKRLS